MSRCIDMHALAMRAAVTAAILALGGSGVRAQTPEVLDSIGLECEPITETEVHDPGDPHWIGHDARQMQLILGKEVMALGKPSRNLVLVYRRAGANCLDAYVVDDCKKVIKYFCRPIPISPMSWERDKTPPVPRFNANDKVQ